MKYIPNTDAERARVLELLGHKSADELFAPIPTEVYINTADRLPPPLSEIGLRRLFADLASAGRAAGRVRWFCGGGAYHHYIPAIIDPIVGRGEFLTAYTSYQPEVSQGTLQSIFEYQSMVCDLTGMEVANASIYDGATATVEGVLMAVRIRQAPFVIWAGHIHPEYLEVARVYERSGLFRLLTYTREISSTGALDFSPAAWEGQMAEWRAAGLLPEAIADLRNLFSQVASIVIQSPDYRGIVGDYRQLRERIGPGVLLHHVFTNALAFGILATPGAMGADIVTGEGQALGIPLNFGGPWLGIFATRAAYTRQMPGRLVGMASDAAGDRAFVITLSTREQHIRREKATSNICTNQGLMVVRAAMYMAVMGRAGLVAVARDIHSRTLYLLEKIGQINAVRIPYRSPVFNEFVIEFADAARREKFLSRAAALPAPLAAGLVFGERGLLVAVTEMLDTDDLDEYAALLAAN